MPFEQLGRSLMRIRANDHVGAHLITCIFDAALGDFFGLAERSAHADDCGLMAAAMDARSHHVSRGRDTLNRIKAEIGSLLFSAQYQQRPVPLEGNLIRRHWFRYHDHLPHEPTPYWSVSLAP